MNTHSPSHRTTRTAVLAPILILAVALTAGWISRSNTVESTVMRTDSDQITRIGDRWLVNGEAFSGALEEYREEGSLKRRFEVRRGFQHGTEQSFHAGGTFSAVRAYRRGDRHGVTEGWWEDGAVRFRCSLEDGLNEGTCNTWYPDGTLATVDNYEGGQREGLQQGWTAGGNLAYSFVIRDGRRYGSLGAKACFTVDSDTPYGEEVTS